MNRDSLKPFFKNKVWLVNIILLIILIFMPLYWAYFFVIEYKNQTTSKYKLKQLSQAYKELFIFIKDINNGI